MPLTRIDDDDTGNLAIVLDEERNIGNLRYVPFLHDAPEISRPFIIEGILYDECLSLGGCSLYVRMGLERRPFAGIGSVLFEGDARYDLTELFLSPVLVLLADFENSTSLHPEDPGKLPYDTLLDTDRGVRQAAPQAENERLCYLQERLSLNHVSHPHNPRVNGPVTIT